MTDLPDFANFALALAWRARAQTLPRLGSAAENKGEGDYDPVTEADRAAERVIRDAITVAFPDHGIWGEEYGQAQGSSRWSWSVDPIDGTRAFVCGLPTWTTLIALLDEGEPVLGLIDAPVVGETYLGFGSAAWLIRGGERHPIRTSQVDAVAAARISSTDPYLFGGERGELDRVRQRARLARWGLDAYAYARLAAGGLDLVAETGLKPHDWQALVPVVRGAGGVVGNWTGGSDLGAGAVLAAATPALFEEAVQLFKAKA